MMSGRFEEAWRVSDELQRMRSVGDPLAEEPRHLQRVWDGTPMTGRRVLVRCYHGLGDTIQYVRLLPQLRAIASAVILWVQPKLVPLLDGLPGADEVLPLHDGEPDVGYDVDVELAELMHALRITLETVPTRVPYVPRTAPTVRTRGCEDRAIVGLVWQSGGWDERRSIPYHTLAPLGAIPDIEWRLFQHGPALADWHHDFGNACAFETLLEETRAMRDLDLLVSVDTFPAHLAGALGVPVWTLLHAEADWRWMRDRSDTPWYPSMRLLRQPAPENWRDVIAQVCRELGEWRVRAPYAVGLRSGARAS
jgi:hypothetical protein